MCLSRDIVVAVYLTAIFFLVSSDYITRKKNFSINKNICDVTHDIFSNISYDASSTILCGVYCTTLGNNCVSFVFDEVTESCNLHQSAATSLNSGCASRLFYGEKKEVKRNCLFHCHTISLFDDPKKETF